MFRKLTILVAVATLVAVWLDATLTAGPASVTAEARLDAATIRAGLRTADADEDAYITYVAMLVDQGRLPRALVDSTFQWARRQPVSHKRFQYFKNALILRAARIGVKLPRGNVDLTPTVNGRVVVRILLINVPAPNVTVTLRGTNRKTTTDHLGRFTFRDVPLGTYVLDAQGIAAFVPKKGSATVTLPPDPPATGSIFVQIRL